MSEDRLTPEISVLGLFLEPYRLFRQGSRDYSAR